jgi:hypothetical protein
MLPGFKSFKVYRGDTFAFRMTLEASDLAYDVTSHSFAGEIKERGKSTVVASFEFDIEDADSGIVLVTLPATQSTNLIAGRKYVYDIEMTNSGVISTILQGPILVTGDVTA